MNESADDKNLRAEVLSSKYLDRRPWFTVREECIKMPNGELIREYFVHEYPDWVNVIAVTGDKKIVMIRQYRHAHGTTAFEIPAGVCENDGSSLLENAKRELMEETGYAGGTWSHFASYSPNPATHTNMAHTFLAMDVELAGEQKLDKTECIEVHLLSFDEVMDLLKSGGIIQALMAAVLWKFFYEQKN